MRVLERLGFYRSHQVGSHAHFKHPDGRRTTVYVHEGKDVGRKTLAAIIADLGMSVDAFTKALKGKGK